ncbi:MAG: hypothetical protein M0Z31_10505 [Clostridia bacterium]|nr:hypothetical protein [Clostridia bacterium]
MPLNLNSVALYFILLGLGYGVTYVLFPLIARMISKAGFLRPNYRKEEIPVAVGMVFGVAALMVIPVVWLTGFLPPGALYLFLLGIVAMTLFGFLDDVLGSREASGLKGHFKKLLLERELTTGALKALMGGLVALIIALGARSVAASWELVMGVVVHTLIVALSINSVNLLDLRPGRAAKGFLVGALIITFVGWGNPALGLLWLMVGCVMAYLPHDLGARAMMGDTGSNALGVTLGIISVWVVPWEGKLVYLVFLIGFHIFTEKYSLTQVIEKNKFLKYIDMIGRN